jgi:hypothetical protein
LILGNLIFPYHTKFIETTMWFWVSRQNSEYKLVKFVPEIPKWLFILQVQYRFGYHQ